MSPLSHTRMLTVVIAALEDMRSFRTSIFYKSHNARVYDIFCVMF